VDLVTGHGLDAALAGADTVVDLSNIQTLSAKASVQFFTATTGNLLRTAGAAGVQHYVGLSIVGADRAAAGYYAGKLAQEKLITAGDIPWTILRATQFHEFVAQVLGQSSLGPLALVPQFRTQPVAAREVAEALVDAVEAGPQGRIPDLAGPRAERLKELAAAYVRKRGQRKLVLEFTAPGPLWRAMRNGALLPEAGAAVGRQTFAQWLDRDAKR